LGVATGASVRGAGPRVVGQTVRRAPACSV